MTMRPMPADARPAPGEEAVDDLSIEYPCSDGEPMAENDHQFTALTESALTLREWLAERLDVYVGGDMLIYYRMNDNETRIAPDIFVVFGVLDRTPRYSWIVWREGKAPDFVLEIASPGTWRRDASRKREIYAELGVREYWRFDPTGECFRPPLAGERLVDGEYQPIEITADGDGALRGYSGLLALDICVFAEAERNLLRFYDPVGGRWLRTHHEEAVARQAAEAVLGATTVILEATEAARQETEAARQETEAALESSEAARQETEAALESSEAALESSEAARQETEAALESSEAARREAEDELRRLRERLRELESGG